MAREATSCAGDWPMSGPSASGGDVSATIVGSESALEYRPLAWLEMTAERPLHLYREPLQRNLVAYGTQI